MTWFKVDDRFHSHPKVLALRAGKYEETAIALWVKAGAWCMSNLTDGAVPSYAVETLVRRNGAKAAAELVRVGLWEVDGDGFRFRAWDEYQPSKSEVEAKRKKSADKVAGWRAKKRDGNQPCNQVTQEDVTRSVTMPPTRPDPTHTSPSEKTITSESETPPADSPKLDAVKHVFAAWLREHVDPAQWAKCKLNGKRRRVIEARLREDYLPEQLIDAIRGVKLSRWHMGENPDGRKYTGLETVLRDGAQVEKFAQMLVDPPRPRAGMVPVGRFSAHGDSLDLADDLFGPLEVANG